MTTFAAPVLRFCLAAGIAGLLWACVKPVPADDDLHAWQNQARVHQAVRDWLDCEECIDGEWERLMAIGTRAQPVLDEAGRTAEEALGQSSYDPGAPFQLHWVQEREKQRFHRLAKANPAITEGMNAETYARREIRAMLRRYIDRSRTALEGLERPQPAPPCPETERPFNPKS
jgi:hypothetical protein